MYAGKKRVDLSPDARIDFTDILMYSEGQWGAEQRDRYEARLIHAIATLGDFPEMGVRRNELGSGLRAQLVEHHVLY